MCVMRLSTFSTIPRCLATSRACSRQHSNAADSIWPVHRPTTFFAAACSRDPSTTEVRQRSNAAA
eukprot:1766657-Rhodomonas_salina.1